MGQLIQGEKKDLGEGFFIHRVLPRRHRRMVGPFIFWDHMGPTTITPQNSMVVRSHPHIGLSTITYLFSGKILHRDSLGNELYIQPGEVNWMTAGRGIAHSERSQVADGQQPLEGIQVWVALPASHQEVEASFVHQKENSLPLIEDTSLPLRLIAGEAFGKKSPLPVYSPLFYLAGAALETKEMIFPVRQNHEAAVYVVNGEITVNSQSLRKFDMWVYSPNETVRMTAKAGSQFMIFGGEIFPQQPNIWWNFVSFDSTKIQEAKQRWRDDRFGQVINETERISLPES